MMKTEVQKDKQGRWDLNWDMRMHKQGRKHLTKHIHMYVQLLQKFYEVRVCMINLILHM